MNAKRIIFAFVFLILLIVVFLAVYLKDKQTSFLTVPLSTPGVEERMQEKFEGLKIPDDEEKIELKNVSDSEALGIATKKGLYADLPDPEKGKVYRVILENGLKKITLGNLTKTKAGWFLEYDLSKYEGYSKISVTENGNTILEGTF